jgi:hypothetical protein
MAILPHLITDVRAALAHAQDGCNGAKRLVSKTLFAVEDYWRWRGWLDEANWPTCSEILS